MRAPSFHRTLAKFALSLARPRRSRSEPAVHQASPPQSDRPTSPPPAPRAPSPAPTEILEPESDHILATLHTLNIKVRDFAYAPSPLPVAELFDPYRAIAEYEYRLRTTPHVPVPGKTMRRLLSAGWVPAAEAAARLRPIDWDAMRAHDARRPAYPYRTMKWHAVPTPQQRETLLANAVPFFRHLDRVLDGLRVEEERQEEERLRGEEAAERVARRLQEIQERERRKLEASRSPIPSTSAGKKRALDRSPSTPDLAVCPKRIKLSTAAEPQHPASPIVPSRHVTPPASDDESAVRAQRNKGTKGLTRTQTFAQL